MPCLFILFYQTFHSLSQACKNFQILSEKRSVSQSKSGCCSYDNHSVIVFSSMISQSKICFYSIDQSNLLSCFSLPLTFLSTELSLFLRKVCLQYFFLRRMLKYFATLNRVLEILLFRAVITFNWNQLLLRLKWLIKEFFFFFFFFNCNTKNTTLQNKTNTTYNTTYKTLLILLTI